MFAQEFIVNSPIITLGYSTLSDRIRQINLPELDPRVEILIGVQGNNQSEIPMHLLRADTRITYLDSLGVTKSRNYMIDNAIGDYLFFGDDDINWEINNLWEIVGYFENHKDTHLITGRTLDVNGIHRKNYPNQSRKLNSFNSAKTGTVEMAIRVNQFRLTGIYFDEQFGAGSENFLGDEYIFITDALKLGIRCQYLPIDISMHEEISSGVIYGSTEDAQVRSAVFSRVFGRKASLVKIAFLLKNLTKFRKLSLIRAFLGTNRK